ncbi:DnaJ family domain-containing protein [Kytococcus sp. Marseille-QA3725]
MVQDPAWSDEPDDANVPAPVVDGPDEPVQPSADTDERPEMTVAIARTVADQAILQAQRAGEFDDLPGAGRPLEGLDEPYDPEWWARDKLRRENADLSAALPGVMQLRREKAALAETILTLPTERQAREHLEDFNARVIADRKRPHAGDASPPIVGRVDVEEYLARWRVARPVVEAEATRLAQQAAAEAEQQRAEADRRARGRRRWWRRRR